MYTQDDLIKAMQAGDSELVATIGDYFKRMADSAVAAKYAMDNLPPAVEPIPGEKVPKPRAKSTKPKAVPKSSKAKTTKPKSTKKAAPLPAPKDDDDNPTPWLVPTKVASQKNYGRIEDDVRLDGKKPKILTSNAAVDLGRASPELRRAEKSKTKSRNPASNRRAAEKIQWPCESCGVTCEIYPSQLNTKVEDDGLNNARDKQFYQCNKCSQKPYRSR